jgi:hypothetical protein
MILIPKYREIYVPKKLVVPYGIGGEGRLVLRHGETLKVIQDTGWFPNLVTDYGLTRVGSNNWHAYTHIGSSATAPDVLDTTLGSYVASSNTQQSSVTTDPVGPNYQFSKTIARRFPAGTGPTTVREMGIGPNTGNTNMIIHTLVSPAVVLSATQVLDVYHKFTVYPSLDDIVSTVSIDGDTYDYTSRACDVDSPGHNAIGVFAPNTIGNAVYNGNIGASVTDIPSGSTDNATSMVSTDNGQGYNDYEILFGLNDGNFSGEGIRSLRSTVAFDFTGGRQIQFGKQGGGNETIPKTDHHELVFTLQMTWDRYP